MNTKPIDDGKMIRKQILLDKDTNQMLSEMSAAEHRSIASMIRELIRREYQRTIQKNK